ncbi:MAG: hypothetical protein U9N77_07605 [Thermodesulfobacteriota bacterium]|nr:hypothetical protein [Thermodesulfobacteriota bacterium]
MLNKKEIIKDDKSWHTKFVQIWVGHLLASPIRKLLQNPEKILSPHIKPGMTVLDIGCAMVFFSLPMAWMTGPDGKVVCMDIQEKRVYFNHKPKNRISFCMVSCDEPWQAVRKSIF